MKVLGTEKVSSWKEGIKLAKKLGINLEEYNYKKQSMKQLVPYASPEVQQILKQMIKLNPEKRPSAKQLLQNTVFKNSLSMKQLQEMLKER